MDEDVNKLAADLFSEAQNEHMVDSNFTELGKLLVRASNALRVLSYREDMYVDALCAIEDKVSRMLNHD